MRVTVIHNPGAGDLAISASELCAALRAAGTEPVYASTKHDDWRAALQDPGDAVIAVGGDGTVAKVVRRIAGKDTRLAIVPAGTANNIARSLGIAGDWRDLVACLDRCTEHRIDAGITAGPWGDRLFVEGIGVGLVANAMHIANATPDRGESRLSADERVAHEAARVRTLLAGIPVQPCTLHIDGETLHADAILVEVLNTPLIGPRLELAPGADPGDGMLRVVVLEERDRPALDVYLRALSNGEPARLDACVRAARSVRFHWPRPLAHVDDSIRRGAGGGLDIAAGILPSVVRILVPVTPPL